jgi:transcriptional regulator with XRE-family HTH domain
MMTPEQQVDALKNWPEKDVCKMLASQTRKLRTDDGHTQEEFAALANIPLSTYKRFEMHGSITLVNFLQVLRALNRAQYLQGLLPGGVTRPVNTYNEKIAKAISRSLGA